MSTEEVVVDLHKGFGKPPPSGGRAAETYLGLQLKSAHRAAA